MTEPWNYIPVNTQVAGTLSAHRVELDGGATISGSVSGDVTINLPSVSSAITLSGDVRFGQDVEFLNSTLVVGVTATGEYLLCVVNGYARAIPLYGPTFGIGDMTIAGGRFPFTVS